MQSRAAIGRRIVEPAPQRMAEQRPQRSALAATLNARPAVQQLHAMSALLTRGRTAGAAAIEGLQRRAAQPVQMVHPASTDKEFRKVFAAAFSLEVANLILDTELEGKEAMLREDLTGRFYAKGGSPWDALRLLKLYPKENDKLEAAYAFYAGSGKIDPKEALEAKTSKEVQRALASYRGMGEADLLNRRTDLASLAESSPDARAALTAVDILLRAYSAGAEDHETLARRSDTTGFTISVYGRQSVMDKPKARPWIENMMEGLLNASFLAKRRPPLQIRIIIHDRKTRDVASTHADGNLITVNVEEYQVDEFSTGQMIGLIAHELGVHTLGKLTLTPEELEAEQKDKESLQKGKFAGSTYTVGKDPKAERQQADHLTIGRAILGQKSALPRLGMYENTMISLIEAETSKDDQRETAAAYCIDIARIVLLNDLPPEGLLHGVWTIPAMANAAVAEWSRIQNMYGEAHPVLKSIEISTAYMLGNIASLGKLAFSLRNQPSYL